MIAITFIASDGTAATIDASEDVSLMENAIGNGVPEIEATCSGNAYCGTCRVYIDPAWQDRMGEASEIELPMIETSGDETPGVRLSCQIIVTPEHDGLIVRTPEMQN